MENNKSFLENFRDSVIIVFLIMAAISLVSIAVDVNTALQEFLAIPIYD